MIKGNHSLLRKTTTKVIKNTYRRRIHFDTASSKEEIDEQSLCDDNDETEIWTVDTEVCNIYEEFGTNKLWYCCALCSNKAYLILHKTCSTSCGFLCYKCNVNFNKSFECFH